MLLLYEIAIALCIGLGRLFILDLLLEQAKSLFQRRLFYGKGALFSMAVLVAMIGIALAMRRSRPSCFVDADPDFVTGGSISSLRSSTQ